MDPHVKNERARLVRRLEQLLKHWAATDPDSAAEFRAAKAALDVLEAPGEGRYRQFRSTIKAVYACLTHEKRRMRKKEIANELFEGGFVMDPEIGRRLVVMNIDKNIQRGKLTVDADGLVGLPEWNSEAPAQTKD